MGYLETHIPNKPWIRRIVDCIKEMRLYHYYAKAKEPANNQERIIIYMADGRMKHGGLADRLCGMISAYNYSKKNGYQFKIHYINPFNIKEIFVPNTYNWQIMEDDISYNSKDSRPVYVSCLSKYHEAERYFNNKIGAKVYKQIHLYTNARYFYKKEFSEFFNELFRPSYLLKSVLKENEQRLPEHYISLTFRFQQLLGDFKEDGFPTLKSEKEKQMLINKCMKCLIKLRNEQNLPVLVTSDSVTFLREAEKLENIYTIPGSFKHMEYVTGLVDISEIIKSYVDFFMLAKADTIYLCNLLPLYKSRFAETASFVYNKPYIILTEDYIE